MLRWVLPLIVALAAVAPTHAQEQVGWAHKLLIEKGKPVTEHDFGNVPKGAILQHRFPVQNIYGVPLTIQLGVSCDCVNVTMSSATLEPRQTAHLDLQMDTRRFGGYKEVWVYFTVTNPQYFSTAILKVKANCRMDVTLNPGVVNFGIVPRGQQPQTAVNIDYAGRLDWQVTNYTQNELFDVNITQRQRLPGRVGYTVQMTLKPDAPPGSYKQELLLATNDPNAPTVPVPYELTVQPPLAVAPEVARFAGARTGATSEMKVFIRSGGKPFRITGVDGLSDGLALADRLPTEAKPVHILTLKFTPNGAGAVNKKLVFMTDGGAGLAATLPVEATVAPQ